MVRFQTQQSLEAVVASSAWRLLSFCGRFRRTASMSRDTQQHHVTKKSVVYEMPGADSVIIRRDGEFRECPARIVGSDARHSPVLEVCGPVLRIYAGR